MIKAVDDCDRLTSSVCSKRCKAWTDVPVATMRLVCIVSLARGRQSKTQRLPTHCNGTWFVHTARSQSTGSLPKLKGVLMKKRREKKDTHTDSKSHLRRDYKNSLLLRSGPVCCCCGSCSRHCKYTDRPCPWILRHTLAPFCLRLNAPRCHNC